MSSWDAWLSLGQWRGLLREVYDALGDKRDLSSFIISNCLPACQERPRLSTLPVTEGDRVSHCCPVSFAFGNVEIHTQLVTSDLKVIPLVRRTFLEKPEDCVLGIF